MKRNFRDSVILPICFLQFLLFSCIMSHAQITQVGIITGIVTDEEKTPLPGVQVTISSPALILPQMSTVTVESGLYRFPALPPGVYNIQFELPGFNILLRQGIRVSVGTTTTINASLPLSEIQEMVVVTGVSPMVDVQRTTLSSSLTTDILQNIPSARNLASFHNMLPGVSDRATHGSSVRDNIYNIDGVNISDPVVGTESVTFSVDIMEELSAQTGALSAEYGGVRGSAINVITKSGGNTFSGEANLYFRNNNLQWDNSQGTPLEGRFVGFNHELDAGANIGGPVIKDKVWFFGNYSYLNSQSYISGYPWDKPTNIPTDTQRRFLYGKITLQPSEKDKIILSYNYSGFEMGHTGASNLWNEEATALRSNPGHTPNLLWTRFFSSNFFVNVKMAYSSYGYDVISKTNQPLIYDSVLRQNSNGYGRSDRTVRDRFQIMADATYFVDRWIGTHEFKFGLEHEFSWETRDTEYHFDAQRGGIGSTIYVRNGVPDYFIHYEDFVRKCQLRSIGVFFQDTWNPSNRLTLNLGVRFDHQQGIIPKQGEDRRAVTFQGVTYDPQVYETNKPIIWNNIAPRLGLTYDIFGDAKTLFKASFARYTAANIIQYFVGTNPNSFMSWRYALNPDWTIRGEPYLFSATAASRTDPDLKAMFMDEFTIGLERELGSNLGLSLRYIKKKDHNVLETADANALDVDELHKGNLVWTNFYPIEVKDPYTGGTATFWAVANTGLPVVRYMTNPPDAQRDYDGLEIALNKRLANKWQMMASYVWSYSRGLVGTHSADSSAVTSYFTNPNVHVNAYGRFPLDRKHQFKIYGTWEAPWEVFVSGFMNYASGAPYARTIRSQDLGLRLPQGNVTILAEKRGARELPPLATVDLRLEKAFPMPRNAGRLSLMVDMFNVFNTNTAASVDTISSSHLIEFERIVSIMNPRIVRLGVRFQF